MHLVALGLGVSFTSEATVATQFPELTFRPIAGDAARAPFSAVWLSNNDNPAFRRFLSLARSMSKKWEKQPRDATESPSVNREKSKPISDSRHSHVVLANAQSAYVKRQNRSGDRPRRARTRDSGKRRPNRR
jgi:hypothetical protein